MAKQKLIHISDIHVRRRKRERERFARVIRAIAERYPRVPVLVTGDLTDSAKPKELEAARELLDVLAKTNPVLAVPGNHDYAWKGNVLLSRGWDRWVAQLGEPLGWRRRGVKWMTAQGSRAGVEGLGVWPVGKMVYFGIDSGDPRDEVRSARGWISKALADALAAQLDAYEGKTRVAFLHHHPFTAKFLLALKGSKRLMTALEGRCEVLLFGHEHHAGIWRDRGGIPFIAASHQTTEPVAGDRMMFAVVEIDGVGQRTPSVRHYLELV